MEAVVLRSRVLQTKPGFETGSYFFGVSGMAGASTGADDDDVGALDAGPGADGDDGGGGGGRALPDGLDVEAPEALFEPPGDPGAVELGTRVLVSVPQADSPPRFDRITSSMFMTIQKAATDMVTRVKTSPAFVPNALEPPMPPKAPARPPPLPRWMRTRQIKKSDVRIKSEFRIPVRIFTARVLARGWAKGDGAGRLAGAGGRDRAASATARSGGSVLAA